MKPHSPQASVANSTAAHLLSLSLMAAATMSLVACGGGSDSTTGTPSASTGTAGTTGTVAIQTTVPEPPLAVGSPERMALDYMNRQRLQCGFGALRYNKTLETTGNQHAFYAVANESHPQFHPHLEVAGLPGFTAVWPTERAQRNGYQTNGHEVGEIGAGGGEITAMVSIYRTYQLDLMLTQYMRDLAIAPYHAMHFFAPYTEVGVGSYKQETLLPASVVNMNGFVVQRPESIQLKQKMYAMLGYGMDQLGQFPATGTGVRTYPCEGSTDVSPALHGEWTDPSLGPGVTPGRELGTNPTGSTIMVMGERDKTLVLQKVELTRVSTGEAIGMYSIRTKANDPMAVYYRNDWTGYAMPDKALAPNETYRVQVTGTSGGAPFSRDFRFTTGKKRVAPLAE